MEGGGERLKLSVWVIEAVEETAGQVNPGAVDDG